MFRKLVQRQQGAIRQQIRRNHHGNHQELPPWAFEQAYPKGADKKAAEAFKAHAKHEKEHAQGTTKLWQKISLFVAAPAIVATAINTYFVEAAHAKHREHLAHVSDEEWPVQYEFQNVRSKPFFWGDGDKTLFWNPIINRHIKSE